MSRAQAGPIDVHAHYLAPDYTRALHEAQLHMIGGIPLPDWSPQLALDFMDAHGLAAQVLSVSDPGVDFLAPAEAAALARACNEYLARVRAEHSGRFAALAVLPLQEPALACREAAHALDELALDGVGILSSALGRYPGDAVYEPLLAELDARGAWVFVHPTAPAQRPEYGVPVSIAEYPFDTTRAIVSLLFNGAFERYGRIRWHFAHGGGTIAMLRRRLRSLAENAAQFGALIGLPSGSSVLGEDSLDRALDRSFFDTALVFDAPTLATVRGLAGAERMLFGSDWPFAAILYESTGELQPALAEVLGPEEREAVARASALRQFPRL